MTVYFAQKEDGLVKIGFTMGVVYERLRRISQVIGAGLTLIAMVDGGRSEEEQMHLKFRNDRVRHEWFHPSDELMEFCFAHRPPNNHSGKLASGVPTRRSIKPKTLEEAAADRAPTVRKLIGLAGGLKPLALKLDIHPTSVASWKRVPIKRVAAIKELFPELTLHDLRPDYFFDE